jgi:hypothetical protein
MGRLIPASTGFEWYRHVRIPPDSLPRRSCGAAQAGATAAAGAAGGRSRSRSRDRVRLRYGRTNARTSASGRRRVRLRVMPKHVRPVRLRLRASAGRPSFVCQRARWQLIPIARQDISILRLQLSCWHEPEARRLETQGRSCGPSIRADRSSHRAWRAHADIPGQRSAPDETPQRNRAAGDRGRVPRGAQRRPATP